MNKSKSGHPGEWRGDEIDQVFRERLEELCLGDMVHVYNKERAAEFRKCGIDPRYVPIKSIIPAEADLPIGRKMVYEMDVRRLTPEQLRRLVDHIAEKFELPRKGLELELKKQGVPILVEDVVACSTHPFRYL